MGKRGKMLAQFGARYGRTLRKRVATIKEKMKERHLCPSCESQSVKRVSVGIWRCRRCGYTYAGGAYAPSTKLGEISRRATEAGATKAIRKETLE